MRLLFLIFLFCTLTPQGLSACALLSATDEVVADAARDGALYLRHRERQKVRRIEKDSRITVYTLDEEWKGRLVEVVRDSIFVDIGSEEMPEIKVCGLREVETLSLRNTGTTLGGVALCLSGVGMLVVGGVTLANDSSPVSGAGGVLIGGAFIGMAPGLFKNGRKFHMDGEWRLIRADESLQ